jgi:hypothetical protein
MTNASKRIAVAWTLITAPVLLFGVSWLMGSGCPSTLMFWAVILASHMPFVALPFWAMFHGRKRAAILWGWAMFFFGEAAFNAFYFTYYKEYGWPTPGVPGGVIVGLLFGWMLGFLVAQVAGAVKPIVDRVWPIAPHDSFVA